MKTKTIFLTLCLGIALAIDSSSINEGSEDDDNFLSQAKEEINERISGLGDDENNFQEVEEDIVDDTDVDDSMSEQDELHIHLANGEEHPIDEVDFMNEEERKNENIDLYEIKEYDDENVFMNLAEIIVNHESNAQANEQDESSEDQGDIINPRRKSLDKIGKNFIFRK
ncbi:CLUMA_CG020828, isoform A [Clunio marinus]|uniref:CLUMA_CG020828, isoform A n=1 Tax=Clunio marinus TaxID=568069 RepID=A0A1J1J9K6_9DIPT|nr:CLUMA_CG020828, isoform A [Clunio marinus]